MYCIDASVLTNSVIEGEEHHEFSKELIKRILNSGISVLIPEIALPEVASAISRGTGDKEMAIHFAQTLRKLPNIVFVPIDSELSDISFNLAAKYKLRGCDSIYVGVAENFKATLITLDNEQKKRIPSSINAFTPKEELERLEK